MVYLKSPYPQPPPVQDRNVHHFMFNAPGQAQLPDHPLYIDALTGRERTWYQFRDLVYDGATAIGTPVSEGGLGLDGSRDIVGILSHNCLVRRIYCVYFPDTHEGHFAVFQDYVALPHSLLAAAVPFALLSAHSTAFELAHLLRTTGATTMFVDPTLIPQTISVAREVGLPDSAIHVLVLEGNFEGRRSFQDMVDTVRKRGLKRLPVKPVTRDTLAYLVCSSGTSGLPKGSERSQSWRTTR